MRSTLAIPSLKKLAERLDNCWSQAQSYGQPLGDFTVSFHASFDVWYRHQAKGQRLKHFERCRIGLPHMVQEEFHHLRRIAVVNHREITSEGKLIPDHG